MIRIQFDSPCVSVVTVLTSVLCYLFATLLLLGLHRPAYAAEYYFSGGQKVPVTIAQDRVAVRLTRGGSIATLNSLATKFSELASADNAEEFIPERVFLMPVSDTMTLDQLRLLAFDIADEPDVLQAGLVIISSDSAKPMVLTDEFIVKFATGTTQQQIKALNQSHAVEIVRQNRYSPNEYLLKVTRASGRNALDMAAEYAQHANAEFAHPNFIQRIETLQLSATPNDPLFNDQWHINNTGQGGGVVDADANVEEAWQQLVRTRSDVIIAVIDDAIERDHEDLVGNMFINTAEVAGDRNGDGRPGVKGVDDDGDGLIDEDSAGRQPGEAGYSNDLVNDDDENGYADDTRGWDFFDYDSDPSPATTSTDNHGTAVTGVAAARSNNNIGVSGSCPNCRILPLRWGFTLDRMAEAFRYAGMMGASLVSNSWGWRVTDNLRNAINDISVSGRNGRGVVVLFAIGNSNKVQCDSRYDVASLNSVIAIGSSNNVDRRSGYSSFGPCLDVLAPSDGTTANPGHWGPGRDDGSTLSITTTDRTGARGYNNINQVGTCTGPGNTNYTNCFGGTSSATPLAAGIVGLILQSNQGLTKDHVQTILEQTTNKIDGTNANYDLLSGYSESHGFGRIDACRAVLDAVDLHDNACIDRTDINTLLSVIRGNTPQDLSRHDLNGDGLINVADVRKLAVQCTNRGCAPCSEGACGLPTVTSFGNNDDCSECSQSGCSQLGYFNAQEPVCATNQFETEESCNIFNGIRLSFEGIPYCLFFNSDDEIYRAPFLPAITTFGNGDDCRECSAGGCTQLGYLSGQEPACNTGNTVTESECGTFNGILVSHERVEFCLFFSSDDHIYRASRLIPDPTPPAKPTIVSFLRGPNPAGSFINFIVTIKADATVVAQIKSGGTVLKQKSMAVSKNVETFITVQTSSIASGHYTCRVETSTDARELPCTIIK